LNKKNASKSCFFASICLIWDISADPQDQAIYALFEGAETTSLQHLLYCFSFLPETSSIWAFFNMLYRGNAGVVELHWCHVEQAKVVDTWVTSIAYEHGLKWSKKLSYKGFFCCRFWKYLSHCVCHPCHIDGEI
jgi:hypothetical protein